MKNLFDGIECNYGRDNYCEVYYETEDFYRLYSKTNFLNPLIDLYKFRTKYNLYVFDLSNQKDHITKQPIRLEFEFSANINIADYSAYALV